MIQLLALFLVGHAQAEQNIPDFNIQTLHQGHHWTVLVTPPEKHHFNLEAPTKFEINHQPAIVKTKTANQLDLRATDVKAHENDLVSISVFLCDEAKTYCVKKVKETVLSAKEAHAEKNQVAVPHEESAPPVTQAAAVISHGKKDHHGFWDNNLEQAVKQAKAEHKPLMIDFYGIWCPPCNLLNETVFPKAKFQGLAKNFVLLKIDVDVEQNLAFRDFFKVGGYPTLVFAKTSEEPKFGLSEIDRVVGYLSLDSLANKMEEVFANRNDTLEDRLAKDKAHYAETLKKLIQNRFAQNDSAGAGVFADEAIRMFPNDTYFMQSKLGSQVDDHPEILKTAEANAVLKTIWQDRKNLSVETLVGAQDMVISNTDQASSEQLQWAADELNALEGLINPKTQAIPGSWVTTADIASMRVDLADAKKDEKGLKAARENAIKSYQDLIQFYHDPDSRGLHLELGYYLWANGHFEEAKKLYDRFVAKYPKEFTFYHARSRMYLEQKNLVEARKDAEQAYVYAYGDNKLRVMNRLAQVMKAQEQLPQAKVRAQELIASYDAARTDRRITRLIKAIQKTLDETSKK